jgi:hypothetical protein
MADGITGLWPLTLIPLATVAFLVVLGRGHRSRVGCWAVVGVVFAVTTLAAHGSMSVASGAASTVGIGRDSRWIDHAVPKNSDVVVLWVAPRGREEFALATRDVWMSEFFNRSVGKVVEIGTPMPYGLPHENGTIRDGILRNASGDQIRATYVLAPCRVGVSGQVIARDPQVNALLYRVGHEPLRLTPANRRHVPCGREGA